MNLYDRLGNLGVKSLVKALTEDFIPEFNEAKWGIYVCQ